MATYLLKSLGHSVAKCLKRAQNCNIFGNTAANFHSTRWNLQSVCSDRPPIITRLALPPDYDNVVEFMCEVFYKQEPAIVNVGLGNTEAPLVWRKIMEDQVKHGLSIIAENSDHCLVGAALNCVSIPEDAQVLYDFAKCCDCEALRNVLEFYGYVMEAPNLWKRFCVSTIFEVSSLAVSEEYRGTGISRMLAHQSWNLARDCGYEMFRIDCNSKYVAKVCCNFGWEEVWRIPFCQYVCNGKIIFKNVKEPHTICRVFIDHLDYTKTFHLSYDNCKCKIDDLK